MTSFDRSSLRTKESVVDYGAASIPFLLHLYHNAGLLVPRLLNVSLLTSLAGSSVSCALQLLFLVPGICTSFDWGIFGWSCNDTWSSGGGSSWKGTSRYNNGKMFQLASSLNLMLQTDLMSKWRNFCGKLSCFAARMVCNGHYLVQSIIINKNAIQRTLVRL
jgi:hypothetical protein